MPAICLILQAHHPEPLSDYSFFEMGRQSSYFNETLDQQLIEDLAKDVYLPSNAWLLQQLKHYEGQFRLAIYLSGTLLDRFATYTPSVIDSFRALAETGCVEFLLGPYAHSISFLHDREEFRTQLELHQERLQTHLGQTASVVLHTELITHNYLAYLVAMLGYTGLIVEGNPQALRGKSPNHVFRPQEMHRLGILARNPWLSDDLNLRLPEFMRQSPTPWKLFAQKVKAAGGDVITLMGDYARWQLADPQYIPFWDRWLYPMTKLSQFSFQTPREVLAQPASFIPWSASEYTSRLGGNGLERVSGNVLQQEAQRKLFQLLPQLRASR